MLSLASGTRTQSIRAAVATIAAFVLAALWVSGHAQSAVEGETLGALAKANLAKPRAAAPIDLTGTYNFKVEGTDADSHKFLPLPKLKPAAQALSDKMNEYRAKGFDYRNNAATCWPYGVPQTMTRYWPMHFVQLPTVLIIISMVNSNVRYIYTDGRQHPADEDLPWSYNGHSIGHWEGRTLVVDTVGFTDVRHYVSDGVQAGHKLHVIERISLSDANTLQIEFAMTDPDNWDGIWKNTKHYNRTEYQDIQENTCIYEEEAKLPGFKNNLSK